MPADAKIKFCRLKPTDPSYHKNKLGKGVRLCNTRPKSSGHFMDFRG